LHHSGDEKQAAGARFQASRERAKAEAREDGGDRQERESVAQILVLQELEERQRRQERREQEPVAPPRRDPEGRGDPTPPLA